MLKLLLLIWTLLAASAAVECPDKGNCDEGQTCCSSPNNEYQCCPFEQAECCEDHIHCCPSYTVCDQISSSCINATVSIPWMDRTSAAHPTTETSFWQDWLRTKQGKQKDNNITCNGTSLCPDGCTCCMGTVQKWECCPLPQAVCCADYRHCCPHGQRCNLANQRCDTDLESMPWFEKIPAIQRKDVVVKDVEVKEVKVKNVSCDQTAACPDKTTCCKTLDGGWGCCPFPNAVCCSDYRHCCPHGQKCNLEKQRCDTDLQSLPWFEKIPANQRKNVEADSTEDSDEEEGEDDGKMEAELQPGIKCDATSSCPALTTCCFMEDFHKYGCCPLPKAVCCTGGMYCCPESYTCNMQTEKCVRGDEAIPWFSKRPILTKAATFQPDYRQCDGTSQCPALSTCCRLPVGEWGCCPLQDAVCCSGSSSCCPKGYSCSEEGQCIQKARLDWSMWKMLLSDKKDPEFM
ncbi:granulin a isoform X1 [Gouania willdenowi]|uniref:granulin a isoform X1 n=1 Tax=Gouania willdenowi TaxID=441366 RepID=UPI001056D24E|nr:progranulin-like isoform X1 [Gouania willdenowi]